MNYSDHFFEHPRRVLFAIEIVRELSCLLKALLPICDIFGHAMELHGGIIDMPLFLFLYHRLFQDGRGLPFVWDL